MQFRNMGVKLKVLDAISFDRCGEELGQYFSLIIFIISFTGTLFLYLCDSLLKCENLA